MEGATGSITNLKNGWVRKTIKKKMRGKTRNANDQYELQSWSHKYLTPANGYTILYTPNARKGNTAYAYNMEKIDSSDQIMKITDPALGKEVVRYLRAGIQRGLFLNDLELYKQPDGRVAVLDFDKVGTISEDTVTYPPSGRTQPLATAIQQYYLTPDLAEKVMAKRSRSKSKSPNKTKKNGNGSK